MPLPLKEGTNIYVERKSFQPEYAMPSMEMATDHYSIGYVISGDRRTITPNATYSYHAGDVAMSPPYVYHRTVAESGEPYERILIKYTPDFVKPFIENVGRKTFDDLYESRVCHFTKEAQEKIFGLFTEMAEEFQKDRPYKEFLLQGMLFRLLATVWEEKLCDENVVRNRRTLSLPVMDAITYMENWYSKDPSLQETAKVAGFSTAYFSRLFQSELGMSYTEYLTHIKIRHVQILLTQTDKSIMGIAQETGFCHGNYLSEQFKKAVGMTPGNYRRNARGNCKQEKKSILRA